MGRQAQTPPETPAAGPATAMVPAVAPGPKSPTALAPGFRFHPTDEELVSYYLKRKVSQKPVRFNAIAVVDIYKNEPWDLSEMSRLKTRDQEWYFFCALDKKYGNGGRMNRATGKGYWKATGKDREVRRDSQLMAMKKTLVFHKGRAPGGQRTNWVMHEYRLVDEELERIRATQAKADAYVLCRVFHKNNIGPPNGNRYAPFVEEEWEDGELAIIPGEDAVDEVTAGHDACAEINHVEQDTHSASEDPLSGDDLPKNDQNVVPVSKTEVEEDCAPVCVFDTEAHFPILQYKRRKHNNDLGFNPSNTSENSTRTAQDPCSSTTTTATTTTDTTITATAATTTAISALLEFSQMEPIEPEKKTLVSPAMPDAISLESSVPPSCMKVINDLQCEIHKISVDRETLKLEVMSAQAMINILQSRIDFLTKENEDLKRSIRGAQ